MHGDAKYGNKKRTRDWGEHKASNEVGTIKKRFVIVILLNFGNFSFVIVVSVGRPQS